MISFKIVHLGGIAPGRLPTTDLYFRDACADRLSRWGKRASLRAIGANSFVAGDTMLLARRDREPVMTEALRWPGRLIYLIDDDIAGAAHSADLPAGYRARLAAFDRDFHRPLLARADRLVAASAVLADRLAAAGSRQPISLVEPYWREGAADQRHFAGLAGARPLTDRPLTIAHLGSASHTAGLAALAPALTALFRRHAFLRFTYVAAAPMLGALDSDPRVTRVAPMPWPRYRRWLARQRFHLGLYPLTDSPFDRARSGNKLREHAVCGAVGVYPRDWLPAQALGDAALTAPAQPGGWHDMLAQTIARRGELGDIAAAAARSLSCHDDRARQQELWSDLFDIRFS